MDTTEIEKLRELAQKALNDGPGVWPFHSAAFKARVTPQIILDLIGHATTTESQITSGKAESIDRPDFVQMIRTIWLTTSTSLAEERIAEVAEEIKLFALGQHIEGKRQAHEQAIETRDSLIAERNAMRAERDHFKAIAERQAAGLHPSDLMTTAVVMIRERGILSAHVNGEVMTRDEVADALAALLSPAQQEPTKDE